MGVEGSQGSHTHAAELVGLREVTVLYDNVHAVQWEGRKAVALCFGTLFGDNSIDMFPL